MDDSCAVCAESLEWVAYGSCGHKEVCSTCVARLRFICDDRRCCICKTESPVVFVTKALGDYTKMINDFSVLPTEVKEGRAGSYWYHEDTQAYFDDLDHYKMIKAMCRLSCSVCDRMEEHATDGPKRRARFRSIDQLKGHLFHQHRMLMCSLCLEGRKVFICEQKLYSREQLKQHIHTGDSDVDGTENERGGFMGHPLCEFCRSPFYGDNELFTHMSTEHYTCHICQRQHPGQYEYYKNYDDLEIHFRHEHFLCEDESCLAKKFIVFQSEAEMKRHNTLEHGGRMSRSQRNAALQIPTSFQYRRNNEQDNRHGRGRGRGRGLAFRRDASDADLSRAIEASFETAQSSNAPVISDHGETSGVDPIIQPFESLATTDLEPPSRYLQAVSHRPRNTPLEESSFPPLVSAPAVSQQRSIPDYEGLQNPFPPLSSAPAGSQQRPIPNHEGVQNPFPPLASAPAGSQQRPIPIPNHEGLQNSFPPLASAPSGSQQRPIPDYEGLQKNTMAENLRRQNKKKVSVLNSTQANSGQAWPAASRAHVAQAATPVHPRPNTDSFPGLLPTSGQSKPAINPRSARSSYSSSVQGPSVSVHEPLSTGFLTSSNNRGNTSRISHSSSAPNLVEAGSTSDFPPVSAAVQTRNQPADGQVMQKVEDVYTANKSMVERIRSALDFDQDKYAAFKEISGEYRQGLIDAATYLAYAQQFGLSHLVLDLARLCPDPNKERELVAAYNAAQGNKSPQENGQLRGTIKGKNAVSQSSNVKENLADSILSTVRKLQSNYKPSEEEVETLPKDGYRTSKGKSKVVVDERRAESNSPGLTILKGKGGEADFRFDGGGSNQSTGDGDGKSKQRKKTSKFHRVRLGDGSIAALLDAKHSDPDSDSTNAVSDGGNDTGEGLPVRGVWRNGGGHKLVAMTSKDPHK